MTPLYAGIVRVSKLNGRTAGSATMHSDQEQVSDCERYAAELGGTVTILPPELDVSGGNPINKRPSLQAAIEGVESGQYAGIIVAYLSRLTRSRSGLEIWDRVEAAGGKVLCAQERLDTSTATGRYIRDIHLANAVREREQKGEDWARRRALCVQAGVWMGPAPRGYDRGPDRRLVPNADAPLIVWAYKHRAGGGKIMDIARRLGCSTQTVTGILNNRVYLGELHSGDKIKPNLSAHPPIIDAAMFAACQMKNAPKPPRSDLPVSLLAGIVRCDGCGRVLKRGRSSSKDGRFVTFSCPSYRNCTPCDSPASISAPLIEGWVETEIARPVFDRARNMDEGQSAEREQADLDAAQAELDAWIENVPASSPSYAKGLAIREERVAVLTDALNAKVATFTVVDLPADYEELTPEQRNAWLRTWLSEVRIRRVGRGKTRVQVTDRVALAIAADGTVFHGDCDASSGVRAA